LSAPDPVETQRGFLIYGGDAVETSYGHSVRVQESSSAEGPHVWLFVGESPTVKAMDPHLSLAEAIEIRDRLDQFISMTAARWGRKYVTAARREVARRRLGKEG